MTERTLRVGPEQFYVRMTDNTHVSMQPGGGDGSDPAFPQAILFEGECARGLLTLEVPARSQLESLNYQLLDPLTGDGWRVRWGPLP